jgi:hypothetical protein
MTVTSVSASAADSDYTPGKPVKGDYDSFAAPFLEKHCADCHGERYAEAELNLCELGPVDETNAAVWKTVWAQVTLREMPPEDESQPEIVERLRFSDWIVGELQLALKDKGGFHAHLDPKKANYVDHDLLFGPLPEGISLEPTSSPARIWRVTREEHITRLNELINTEPAFDPKKPGLRTHGDVVPTNHGGELKLYFGLDRIIKIHGGLNAWDAAMKNIPAVLSSDRTHGFENYANFYSVNSAEATQIVAKADAILRYMAYGPLSLVSMPEQITDDPKTYEAVMPKGDIRATPSSIVYGTKVIRPLTPVYELMKEPGVSEARLRAAIDYLFEALTFRPPTVAESNEYLEIVEETIAEVGKEEGVFMGLSAIFLDRDALFRSESAKSGEPDAHDRVMLQDWELGLAVNHALRYIRPDETLRQAIVDGRMRTREDVKREVTRMLADDSIRKPRVLRFFREFFDYDLAGYICKDEQAMDDAGSVFGREHYLAMFDATASTDRLVELILEKDRDVLRELLTTQKVVAAEHDDVYFGTRVDPITQQIRREELGPRKKRKNNRVPWVDDAKVERAKLDGERIYARVGRRTFGGHSLVPERTLTTAPEGQRLGILTHPSWLVSHSDAMDNHAIHRGIWIRERLLGGGIPDVPITVDAQLPDEPESTLRHRMRVTREEYCWKCHQKMDPLGLPFEMYNHTGLFRTTEQGEPVDTSGEITDSGDPSLDGPVDDAHDMIRKLAESERVEQVFVRHAFRFWMGRNETLNDAPVLQAAHQAYRDNGGSMKALITSLVTSDAFLYRKVEP